MLADDVRQAHGVHADLAANALAAQAALDLKAPLASPTFTGTVSGISKSMVGLSNVDNTSDASKPISTATQAALNLKAPLASPTFTGTVGGITKSMVGLSNVDNTSDASKPVSTATQTALDLKANLASPQFTGTPRGVTEADDDNGTKLATTAFVKSATGLKNLSSLGAYDLNNASVGKFIAVNGTHLEGTSLNWPDSGLSSGTSEWWNVLTYGTTTRTTQLAVFGFNTSQGRVFTRMKHDSTWHPWVELGTKAAIDLKADLARGLDLI